MPRSRRAWPRRSTYAVQPSGRLRSQRRPVSSRTSRRAQSSGVSSGSILPLGNVQSSYSGRWMMAISVSPDRERRTTTPPAALMTLTSATSRILVATVAPSSAETFGGRPCSVASLTAKPRRVEDRKRDPRDQRRGGNRHEPRKDDACAEAPAHGGELLADTDAHHSSGDDVSGADREADQGGALDHGRAHELRRHGC